MSALLTPTPGPWRFDRDEETIVAEVGAVIASVCMAADFPCLEREKVDEVDAECTANANLIAAAPDYDAFAERALPLLEVLHSTVTADDVRKVVWNCILAGRVAIAKARGEQ